MLQVSQPGTTSASKRNPSNLLDILLIPEPVSPPLGQRPLQRNPRRETVPDRRRILFRRKRWRVSLNSTLDE